MTNIMFPVKEVPLQAMFAGGDTIFAPKHKAIVREDTNRVLGIHSNRYKLVTNEEVFGRMDEALATSVLDTNGLITKDVLDHGGARTIRTYEFPEHNKAVVVGDVVNLELRVTNSYDGSLKFNMIYGANRLACTNGMVSLSRMAEMRRKHTASLDIEMVVAMLEQAATTFTENEQMWERWARTFITDEQALAIITHLAPSERLQEELKERWVSHHYIMGKTAWALYQVLTEWSTHTSARTNHGTALLEREDRVRRVLPELEKLAA